MDRVTVRVTVRVRVCTSVRSRRAFLRQNPSSQVSKERRALVDKDPPTAQARENRKTRRIQLACIQGTFREHSVNIQ
jgi:hypothetical protein